MVVVPRSHALITPKGALDLRPGAGAAEGEGAWVGAMMVGVSAWLVATGIFVRLAPPPEAVTRELQRFLMLDDRTMAIVPLLMLVAVLPAVCEELLFRGVVLSGLARAGGGIAIAGSAVMFAAAHPSLYRILPTLFMGAVLGFLAWRSGSILSSMTAHALNNGIVVALAREPELVRQVGWVSPDAPPPWSITGAACGVLIAGLTLVARSRRAVPDSPPERSRR